MTSKLLAALAVLVAALPAAAETCSRSTLDSTTYAYARWCGDPAIGGTLRVARRDGGATEFLQVPVDVYRELIRTHAIARYLATEVEPRYRRAGPATPPRTTPVQPQRMQSPAAPVRPAAAREAARTPRPQRG
jgi:hypothetical protein